jgi:hypothetical protein
MDPATFIAVLTGCLVGHLIVFWLFCGGRK